MNKHLPGIRASFVPTKRLRTHLLSSGDARAPAIVLLHGSLSSANFFEELMLAMSGTYYCVAPDLRGFGETEAKPIDATRGLRDLADDLCELLDTLGIESAHLLGWSAGAGVIMQFAIDQPERVRSLSLVAPVSPYGFGCTSDIHGSLTAEDFSGSGGGTVNAEAVEQLRQADKDSASMFAARQLLSNFYVKPPFKLPREDALVDAVYRTRLGEQHYPGDFVSTETWPFVAPGHYGLLNAISPKYFNTSSIIDLAHKPPVLWVHGDADVIVSDHSLFDLATHYNEQSETPSGGLPPQAQPMLAQTREVLRQYVENGGTAEEITMSGVGHSPFLEKSSEFVASLTHFLSISDGAPAA